MDMVQNTSLQPKPSIIYLIDRCSVEVFVQEFHVLTRRRIVYLNVAKFISIGFQTHERLLKTGQFDRKLLIRRNAALHRLVDGLYEVLVRVD